MTRRIFLNDDSGAVAVIVAVFVVVFVAVSALVVDLGYMYDTRRQLQAIAEAGALAGCQELIASGDAAAAESEANVYVAANAGSGPVDAVAVEQVDVDTGEGSVRVVVSQEAPAMFSRFFGDTSHTVRAAAKARKWQLTGGRYLVPWALPVIRHIDRVEVLVVDGNSVVSSTDLVDGGNLQWSGSLSRPSASGAYDVWVRIYNQYGVVEKLVDSSSAADVPAAAIGVAGTGTPFTSVTLSDDYLVAGSGASLPLLRVVTAAPVTDAGGVSVYVDGRNPGRAMTPDASKTVWTYQLQSSDITVDPLDLLTVWGMDVRIGNATRNEFEAYLHVRRSTHPVAEVDVTPSFGSPGSAANVTVTLNDFYPPTLVSGQTYTLRVGSPAGQVGNFGELNFNTIQHQADCPPDPVETAPGNRYADWVTYGYEGGVHIDDIIDMSPGSSGVNTWKALNDRALWDEDMTVVTPVIEKYEDKSGGSYEVIVENFAAFHITYYDHDGNVEGEFIEYVANPSSFSDTPIVDENAPYAARLVNP